MFVNFWLPGFLSSSVSFKIPWFWDSVGGAQDLLGLTVLPAGARAFIWRPELFPVIALLARAEQDAAIQGNNGDCKRKGINE